MLPNIIVENEDGSYTVFGTYTMVPQNTGFKVISKNGMVGTFGRKNTALGWCIANKNSQYSLANELKYLDKKWSDVTNDMYVRGSIADHSDDESLKEIVSNKMALRYQQKHVIEQRLKKCINIVNYWQQRGFTNEITRSR